MADIELVIKIPEEEYNFMKTQVVFGNTNPLKMRIANGTPLPKGHGRLIDEKEIDTIVNGVFSDFKCSPKTFLNVIHNQCIEAVGTDKAESKEDI